MIKKGGGYWEWTSFFIPNPTGKHYFFYTKYDVTHRFSIHALFKLRKFLSISEIFIRNWCWILYTFSASTEIIWFFIFQFLIWWITLIFKLLTNPTIWDKYLLIMIYFLFLYSGFYLLKFHLKFYITEGYWSVVFFSCNVFIWFW